MSVSRKPLEARVPSEARPERMSRLARLPVFLALEGKRCVVAGGSPAAAWKAELLSAAERWRPWRSYATHYLWATLESAPAEVAGIQRDKIAV